MDPNAIEVPPISSRDVAVDIAPEVVVLSQADQPGTVDGSNNSDHQQPPIRASVVSATSAHKKSRQQTPPLPVELIRPPPVISYRHRSEEFIVDGKFAEDYSGKGVH